MGLVVPWSMTLVVVDAYSVLVKLLPRQQKTILIVILGDWVSAVSYLNHYKLVLSHYLI